jgi:predicted Zn-dependent protease
MTKKARVANCVGMLVAALCLSGCSTNKSGAEGVTLFSDDTMRQQGEAAYREILRSERPSRDLDKNELTQCVTERLVETLTPEEHGDLNWEVHVFDDDMANAFALPGGKIGVYLGLFKHARNEHQLAAVLAHEVGHVLADHSNMRASQSTLREVGKVAALLAGVNPAALEAAELAAELGLFLPFGREQESEADALGLMLMARAGFDPEESVYLWRNMDDGGASVPEFISTHPSHDTRIADLQALMSPARVLYESAFLQDRVRTCRGSSFFG